MANNNDLFRDAIEKQTTTTHISTKAGLVDYYRDTYGEKGWKSKIASDLSGTTDKSSREYKSAMRNFQGNRLDREGRDTSRWQTLGQTLPPIGKAPTNGTLTFTVVGTQQDPYGGTRDRTITHTITGSSAYAFANNPNWLDFWNDYDVDGEMMEDGDYEYGVAYVS